MKSNEEDEVIHYVREDTWKNY